MCIFMTKCSTNGEGVHTWKNISSSLYTSNPCSFPKEINNPEILFLHTIFRKYKNKLSAKQKDIETLPLQRHGGIISYASIKMLKND